MIELGLSNDVSVFFSEYRLQKKLLIHCDSFEVGLDVHTTTKRSTKSAGTYVFDIHIKRKTSEVLADVSNSQ